MKPTVAITGVWGGIGQATARLFAAKDWYVIGLDYRDGGRDSGRLPCHAYYHTDLTEPAQIALTMEAIALQSGRLDLLVDNVAVQPVGSVQTTAVAVWDKTLAVNLRAPFLLARAAYELLRRCGGSIVHVASVHTMATSPGIAPYAASKGGLVALTRALALEFAADGIRVNAVLPGAVDTPMLRQHFAGPDGETLLAALMAKTPLQRLATPDDVAKAIAFLGDRELAGFITGQTLVVDGGALARLSLE